MYFFIKSSLGTFLLQQIKKGMAAPGWSFGDVSEDRRELTVIVYCTLESGIEVFFVATNEPARSEFFVGLWNSYLQVNK